MKFQDIDSETLPKSSGFLVKIMHRMSTLLARNTAEEFGSITSFNIVEWRVVSGLYAFGTSRQKRLVDFTGGDQAQTSRILASLERNGAVRSTTSDKDARAKIFELTEEGRGAVAAAMPKVAEYFSRIDQALTAQEKATLIDLLNRMLDAANTDGAAKGPE
jgi:DNA-binding MarR family transcriptional regulator